MRGTIYGGAGDQVIRRVAIPFLALARRRRLGDRGFFIRYAQDGPHIRIRLEVHGSRERDEAATALGEIVAGAHDLTGHPGGAPLLDGIRWLAYEPECRRYGGARALKVAERLFDLSSDVVGQLLTDVVVGSRGARLGQALLLMITTFRGFARERAEVARLARAYAEGYLEADIAQREQAPALRAAFDEGFGRQADALHRFLGEAWERLDTGESLTAPLDAYVERLRDIRDELHSLSVARLIELPSVTGDPWRAALWSIVPSYVHMGSNRLGVTIPEEVYLAHLLSRWLSRSDGAEVLAS